MKKILLLFLILIISSSVSSDTRDIPVTTDSIQGEWYFLFYNKYGTLFGETPPPPTFDIMKFKVGNKVELIASLMNESYETIFSLSNNVISYKFTPKNHKTVKHIMKCNHIGSKDYLLVSYENDESNILIYSRKNKLLKDKIQGKWQCKTDKRIDIMTFSPDGLFRLNDKIKGYYRMWHWEGYGNAITAAYTIPEEYGAFTQVWVYELEDRKLLLTPLDKNKFDPAKKKVWKRIK
ncbi:MAG: hypothetical protein JW871_04310 [Endomicrobiales bacterium]|nr:hypothetical protein [Endomicrobiales bacterium]